MKCPYCKEEIADDAIKCKHCGSDIENFDKKKHIDDFMEFFHRNEKGQLHETYRSIKDGIVKLEGPKLGFSWAGFILFFGIFYLIYHWSKKPWYVTIYFDEDGWYRKTDSNQKSLGYLFNKYKKENKEYSQALEKKREGKKWYQ